jgi:hypothetical protein
MKRAIFTTWFVVCAALPALSAELEFSAGGEVEYDDNVFRTAHGKEDDVLFRLRPGVRVYEDRGDDLNFSVGYEAPVEFSAEKSSEFDQVDHVGNGNFDYHANSQLDIVGSERYGYLRSTLRQPDTVADPTLGSLQVSDQRDRIKTNNATLGTIYHFSPRTLGRLFATSTFFDSSRHDRSRVWSVGGSADGQYRLTLKHQLGAGAGYTFQDFADRQDIPGSQTQSYRMFGTWRWMITDTLAFDLNGGPAYLKTEQDDARLVRFSPLAVDFGPSEGPSVLAPFSSCGTIDGITVSARCSPSVIASNTAVVRSDTIQVTNVSPSGKNDEEVTGFVDAVLTQRWSPTLSTALRYAREQGDASGLGGTVIQDTVSLSNTWDFIERWQLAVRGDWVRRESAFQISQTFDEVSATPQPTYLPPGGPFAVRTGRSFNSTQDVDIDTDTWAVAGRITHQLFKTTSIYVQVRYAEQDSRGDSLGSASDFENFLATFGVRHVFEPIPLW